MVTDYISRGIRALKRFARLYDVAVIVVAHPTKDVGRDGKARPPTLYDIEGRPIGSISATMGSWSTGQMRLLMKPFYASQRFGSRRAARRGRFGCASIGKRARFETLERSGLTVA